jgi:2-keto-4-pentenoate hydratase/2-oxohepta-3-ene-1,7-dioic acid hydratase in catechol pathway
MAEIHFAGSDHSMRAGKIICLGRNYLDHAKEMHAEVPTTPILFLKPPSALLEDGGVIRIPSFSNDMHHEVEMVVLIGWGGIDIPAAQAMDHVSGYAIGLDMTLRDVQGEAKKKGLPWTVAKGFDTSAPVSKFVPKSVVQDPHHLDIRLSVNGTVRQQSNTCNMIFSIEAMIAYISSVFTLEPGDLIFTGTPEGVGPVQPGDVLTAELQHVGSLTVSAARRS